jgi:RNA polymerase sigma-32 factor
MPKTKALRPTQMKANNSKKKSSSKTNSTSKVSANKKTSKKKTFLKAEDTQRLASHSKFEVLEPQVSTQKVNTKITQPNTYVEKINQDELLAPDALTQYLMKIRNYPVLTKEKEHELAIEYFEKGDRAAAELLVKSNLKFVVKIAMEYSKFGAKLIDIIQEGNVGLMHALREYNPYKGVKLISYAVWWIRGYIQDYLMKQQSLVKIGTNQKQRKLFYQLEKEHAKIRHEGLESTPLLLSQRLDVAEKDVLDMQQRLSHKDLSLDQTIGEDSETNWLDQQTDETSEPMDDMIIHAEQLELLKDKIDDLKKDLNEKEIQMLEKRLLSDNPVTLKSLGDEWNVTREAARQTEARLIEKIKKAFLAD